MEFVERVRSSIIVIGALLVFSLSTLLLPPTAPAEGRFVSSNASSMGSFGGIHYVQYDGVFEGVTSTGAYRVPFRISAPRVSKDGNRTIVVEPPHGIAGLGVLELYLGREFLLGRGFSHAAVGYSTTASPDGGDQRILDPSAPGTFINGGFDDDGGRTDDEIIVDFAGALAADPSAAAVLGRIERRYLAGFSDSAMPALRIIALEHFNPVGHLVVLVRVVLVVHRHPEDLAGVRQWCRIDGAANPAGAVDRRMHGRVGQHGEHRLRCGVDRRGRGHLLVGHAR